MLLRADTLHRRLKQLLQTHTHFNVATAWASRGKHLELLEVESSRRRLEVRAIVGIAGNATHPDALAKLNRITHGDLRIVPIAIASSIPSFTCSDRPGTAPSRNARGSEAPTLRGLRSVVTPRRMKVLDQGYGSYTAAIRGRRALLLGGASWSELGTEARQKLTGALRRAGIWSGGG